MAILVQVPDGFSKKNAAARPPITMPAPTLFQNEAANLTRSLRCEPLPKRSSSHIVRPPAIAGPHTCAASPTAHLCTLFRIHPLENTKSDPFGGGRTRPLPRR